MRILIRKGMAMLVAVAMIVGLIPDVGSVRVSAEETSTTTGIEFTPLAGNPEGNNSIEWGDERYSKLLDGKADTKWCCSFTNPSYVIFKTSKPVYVNGYSIWTANDSSQDSGARNPVAWTLSGCNDYDETDKESVNWVTIHEVKGDTEGEALPAANKTEKAYSFAESADSYQYFKLNITKIKDGSTMQLGDFSLTYNACKHQWKKTDDTIAPTCTEGGYDVEKCSLCQATRNVANNNTATGHNWTKGEAVAPTCTEEGYTPQTCSGCSETGKTDIQNALGHVFNEDEKCTRCGALDTSPSMPNGEGTAESPYQISTVRELLWFAGLVNGTMDGVTQNTSASAVLTKDIDFGDNNFAAIGTETYPFSGTFDGYSHTITVNQSGSSDVALFGFLGNSTVKNLTVTGTINTATTKFAAGIAMQTKSNTTATVEKCISDVTIVSSINGDGTHAGLIGAPNGAVNINNCAFTGAINGSSTNSCGGMIGYAKGKVTIKNSYIAATFNLGTTSCHTFSRNFAQYVTLDNCYYLDALGEVPSSATQLTSEQFSSGEAAYRLQEGQTEVVWGQKIGTDKYPVLGGSIVYYIEGNYYNNDINCDEHSWTIIEKIPPTCTETGYDKKQCSKCKITITVKNENSATGHTWIDGDIETPSTCTGEGKRKQTCACGASRSVPIPAGHKYSNGYCTVCNKIDITPKKPNVLDEVYQIGTINELYWFAGLVTGDARVCTGEIKQNTSANAVLTEDIIVNTGVLNADGTLNTGGSFTDWIPIGDMGTPYTGTFDGQNHTISGLYFNDPLISYVGLFGYVEIGGSISNLGIVESYFYGKESVGAVCGQGKCKITNCYNTGTVKGYPYSTGGICGYLDSTGSSLNPANITNCYNTGKVSGGINVGGVCGEIWGEDTNITNCYNTGEVTGSSYVGGVCGKITYGSITNCYYLDKNEQDSFDGTTYKTDVQFASGEVAYLLNGSISNSSVVWRQNLDAANGDATPVLDCSHGIVYIGDPCPYYSNASHKEHTGLISADGKSHTCSDCGTTE